MIIQSFKSRKLAFLLGHVCGGSRISQDDMTARDPSLNRSNPQTEAVNSNKEPTDDLVAFRYSANVSTDT